LGLWTAGVSCLAASIGSAHSNEPGEEQRGLKVRDAIRLIEADGWILGRTRGSHRQYKHPTKPGLVTIPGKPAKDLPVGLQRSILRQAGLLHDRR
jgi:predicted RNA binding protein YcfA (HicA-like mRNA interferase family)